MHVQSTVARLAEQPPKTDGKQTSVLLWLMPCTWVTQPSALDLAALQLSSLPLFPRPKLYWHWRRGNERRCSHIQGEYSTTARPLLTLVAKVVSCRAIDRAPKPKKFFQASGCSTPVLYDAGSDFNQSGYRLSYLRTRCEITQSDCQVKYTG